MKPVRRSAHKQERQRAQRSAVQRARALLAGVPRSQSELRRSLRLLGYYRGIGWHRSVRSGYPADEAGEPIPWLTYPAVSWLASVLCGSERVFEFGSGNSTKWFQSHAASVVSVEHDANWVDHLRAEVGDNVTLLPRTCAGGEAWAPQPDPYVDALGEYPAGTFDVVLVDGMARNSCADAAAAHLGHSGVVVFDNCDRLQFHAGIDLLHAAGFRRLDFVGAIPTWGVFSCTSVFSRELPAGVGADHGYPRFWNA